MFQGRAYTKAPDVHRYSIPERTLSQESRRKNNPVCLCGLTLYHPLPNNNIPQFGRTHGSAPYEFTYKHNGISIIIAFLHLCFFVGERHASPIGPCCHSGAGVPACDSPLDFPLKAVNGGQGRPPHYCEPITLSQNPAPIIEHQFFWPRLFTPIRHRTILPWIGVGTAG